MRNYSFFGYINDDTISFEFESNYRKGSTKNLEDAKNKAFKQYGSIAKYIDYNACTIYLEK